jgi:hypothetical protein
VTVLLVVRFIMFTGASCDDLALQGRLGR